MCGDDAQSVCGAGEIIKGYRKVYIYENARIKKNYFIQKSTNEFIEQFKQYLNK